jgi:hypothetical protein
MYAGTIVLLIVYAAAIALLVSSFSGCALLPGFNDGVGTSHASMLTTRLTTPASGDPTISPALLGGQLW